MTNVGKRFARYTNIHKMSNACASSFVRYIKWLNEWYRMYVKNFNFLFKSKFLRKNSRIEKNWNSFAAATPEKQAPLLIRLPPEFKQLFNPHLLLLKKKKNRTPSNLQRGRHRKRNIVLYPEFFCTCWCIYLLCILEWKRRTPTMVEAHARKVFRAYNN